MRYWFNEGRNELFPMAIPPIDSADCIEVAEADYNEYVALAKAEAEEAKTIVSYSTPDAFTPVTEGTDYVWPQMQAAYVEAPPTQPVLETASVDMEKLARVWRKMQDARDKLSHDFKLADLAIENQQDQIGAALLAAMNTMGGTKLTTAAGVIERKESVKVSVSDWGAYYRCIVEHDAWELLEKRPGRMAVQKWAKTHDGALPPGANAYIEFKVTVTKPGSKEPPKAEE